MHLFKPIMLVNYFNDYNHRTNTSKTKCMLFNLKPELMPCMMFNYEALKAVSLVTFRRIIIDHKFIW